MATDSTAPDARRRAEEALASRDRCSDPECSVCVSKLANALRALLASPPAPACGCRVGEHPRFICRQHAMEAGLPIHPQATGLLVYGADPAPHNVLPAPAALPEEVREAVEMLNLTLRMRETKAACRDRACSNVALGALILLSALDSARGKR